MTRKVTVLVACFISFLAIVLTPIVGPFTFYPTAAYYLKPFLTRPDEVPETANVSYNAKNGQLYWNWETEVENGCASWYKSNSEKYYEVHFMTGAEGCSSKGVLLQYYSFSKIIHFSRGDEYNNIIGDDYNNMITDNGLDSEEYSCFIYVSQDRFMAFLEVVDELHKTARKGMERDAISQTKTLLALHSDKFTTGPDAKCDYYVFLNDEDR